MRKQRLLIAAYLVRLGVLPVSGWFSLIKNVIISYKYTCVYYFSYVVCSESKHIKFLLLVS